MITIILFFALYTLLLLFGIVISFSFAGVKLDKKSVSIFSILFIICGLLQLIVYAHFTEQIVWNIYPLITHLPIILVLCTFFKKRILTSLVAVASAYLCCQPAKWIGILAETLTDSFTCNQIARLTSLLIVAIIVIKYLSPYISDIYNKDTRSVLIFGIVPLVYYGFDYSMGVYTLLWSHNSPIAVEFLPFFLCIVHLVFCVVYYAEHEQKAEAEQKEQIVRIVVEQQKKELQLIKQREQEIRMLRHDMRHLLSNLSLSIEQGNLETAHKMIQGYVEKVASTSIQRYCENETINYILSYFTSQCENNKITYSMDVRIDYFNYDETLFASILSNALDNAINAQKPLPLDKREIKVSLKTVNEKLLVSVKNHYNEVPQFINGLPVSIQNGHGYGTQSIQYSTERLGGTCQFMIQNNYFILRIIL